MSDYEIFCTFLSAIKHVGKVEELGLNKSGAMTLTGLLPDGRVVHIYTTNPVKEATL